MRRSLNLLSKFPYLGIPTDIDNIRCLFESNYAVFYQIEAEIIRIVAIWDCRQNPENRTSVH